MPEKNTDFVYKSNETIKNETFVETHQENSAMVEALPLIYPHAFTKKTDKEGKTYLILKNHNLYRESRDLSSDLTNKVRVEKVKDEYDEHSSTSNFVISEKGVTQFDLPGIKNSLFFEKSEFDFNRTLPPNSTDTKYPLTDDYFDPEDYIVSIRDFRDEDLKSLKQIFDTVEKQHSSDVVPGSPTINHLIASFKN